MLSIMVLVRDCRILLGYRKPKTPPRTGARDKSGLGDEFLGGSFLKHTAEVLVALGLTALIRRLSP